MSPDSLNYAQECKLTLVTAPAGYGKTTAVLDWLDKCGLPSAWLSLDSSDNDPVTFWQYVCASLEDIADGLTKDTEYVFSSQELMKANIHINILIDRLSEVQFDFFLVLDDLHLISAPSILSGLSHLIDYLPIYMHLIIISRTLPELELARHRIKWQVQRLEKEDLRFGEEEISQFYQARGYSLGCWLGLNDCLPNTGTTASKLPSFMRYIMRKWTGMLCPGSGQTG